MKSNDYEAMFTIRMSKEEYERINEFIKKNTINRSAFVRAAISTAVENFNNKK